MAESIRKPLTENELKFLELWESNVLTHKYNINSADLDEGARLIGFRRTGQCASCNRNDAIDLNNKYNQMKNAYQNWKKELEEIQKKKMSEAVKKGIGKANKKKRKESAQKYLENKKKDDDSDIIKTI